jgi:hypothetical protein
LGLEIRTEYKTKTKTANANKIKIIIVPSSISFSGEIRNTNYNKEGDCIHNCYVRLLDTEI